MIEGWSSCSYSLRRDAARLDCTMIELPDWVYSKEYVRERIEAAARTLLADEGRPYRAFRKFRADVELQVMGSPEAWSERVQLVLQRAKELEATSL
jgi:hypothetical protein